MNRNDTLHTRLLIIACTVLTLTNGIKTASAQTPPLATIEFTQPELDQMLAPIALYPDTLLAQVLMASTYPLQVVQVARFIDSNPGLQGNTLARAIAPMPWDPSVKSLSQFPAVLAMMNDRLDWTQRLGQAFLSQQGNVMDTVQNLRMRAQIAGSLQTNSQQRVVAQERIILIEPVNPEVMYVPYYNPVIVYGSWWWPQQPPIYWVPPARFQPPHYGVSIRVGISFGIGVGLLHAVYCDAHPDWRHHQVMLNRTRWRNQHPLIWQHDWHSQVHQTRPGTGYAPPVTMPVATGVRPIPHQAPVAASFAARAPQHRHPEYGLHPDAPQREQYLIANHPAPQMQPHDAHPHSHHEQERR